MAVEGDFGGYVCVFEDDPAERDPVDVGLIDVFAVSPSLEQATRSIGLARPGCPGRLQRLRAAMVIRWMGPRPLVAVLGRRMLGGVLAQAA